MNDEQKKKIIVRNAILWGLAMITPPAMMAIVDATTRETPNQNYIALSSTFVLMGLYVFSNAMLASALKMGSDTGHTDTGQASDGGDAGDAGESSK